MMKRLAGADTTKAGEPDYARMFLRVMHSMMSKEEKPDSLKYKGIMRGGD